MIHSYFIMHFLQNSRERGIVHIGILVAAVAIIGFIVVSSSAEFKNKLFSSLFPKPSSQAAEGVAGSVRFVDSGGNTITATSSATVMVKYVLPNWGNVGTGSSSPQTSFSIVKEAKAQTVGVGTSSPTGSSSPSPSPTPTDGSFCEDSDTTSTSSGHTTKGTCRDAAGLHTDYCDGGTVREWYCTYTSGEGGISNRHCDLGGYVCTSFGGQCSDGACVAPTSPTPSATSSPTVAPTPSPTPVTTTTIVLAENSLFTTNVKTVDIRTFAYNPTTYVFSNSNSGTKTLYVKFIASDNRSQNATPFPATIQLTAPFPTPTSNSQRVFITSTTYNGNLGGLAGADAKCQTRASAANLGGTWKAWLSDSTTSATSRLLHSSVPYKLVNGTVVANNWDDLTDGTLQNTIGITELGTTKFGGVWTNTESNGQTYRTDYCSNFTSSVAGSNFLLGWSAYTNGNWTLTRSGTIETTCNNIESLYCFEQTSVTPTPTPTPSPKPDLTVGSVVATGDLIVGKSQTFTVTIGLTGFFNGSGTLRAQISQPDGSQLGSCSVDFTSSGIAYSPQVRLTQCPVYKVAGIHKVIFTVDSNNTIIESNETNNQRSVEYNISPTPKPDLTISSINILKPVISRNKSSIGVTVKNTGNAQAGASTLSLAITETINKQVRRSVCTAQVSAIGAGQSITVQVNSCSALQSKRSYTILGTIDSTNIVLESSENNNQLTTSIVVK